jgi:putative endopeptidase
LLKRTLALAGATVLAILITLVPAPASQNSQSAKPPAQKSAAQTPKPAPENHGLNPADFDRSCKACDDFYKFVNGGWLAAHPIPPAYPSWGVGNVVDEHNREVLHGILEEAAANRSAAQGSVEQKIGDFYASCMDTAKIDAAGIRPLDGELAAITKVSDVASLEAEVAHLQSIGVDAMFAFGSTQDFKDSSEQTGEADQSGLSLPERDYYTKTDAKSIDIRQKYLDHVTKMFVLMGDSRDVASKEALKVMDIETNLAKASKTQVELRDPEANYHRMDVAQIGQLTPHFSWPAYFREIGYPGVEVVNAAQPDFLKTLDGMLTGVSLDDWKIYLRWHLIHASAPYISKPFVDENFDFFAHVLSGTQEQLPRWRRCTAATDRELGEALGQKYVEKAFPPSSKAAALDMVHNLIDALKADIQQLPWMSAPTKMQALVKVNAIMLKIGYPDKWRDYSAFKVDRGPYVLNNFRGQTFAFQYDLNKIGKPVDRGEWGMTPPTVNAYYNPQNNEIVFPAGILQPPYFDAKADAALNYGAMGAIIGHEMTHGFDDEGRQFDEKGNLRNWWTEEDTKNFTQRADCVAKQFDSFVVDGDLHENGKLVLGESIADLGGLVIAHAAFEKVTAGQSKTPVQGFTPEQRFFIAYARSWAENSRPEFERMLTNVDPHPLPQFRVQGPLSNLPEFSAAFDCKPGDAMTRPADQRCRIW